MTSCVEEATPRDASEAGAACYLLKDADADQVAGAIRAELVWVGDAVSSDSQRRRTM